MRVLLTLLPALALAQTPPSTTPAAPAAPATTGQAAAPATPAKKTTAPAKKSTAAAAAAPGAKAPVAASAQATPAAPKPATPTGAAPKAAGTATTGAGRGTAGRGGRGAVAAKPPAPAPLVTDDEQAIYAIGLQMSRMLTMFDLSASEVEIVKRALSDAAAGKPAGDLLAWGPKIDPLMKKRAEITSEREKTASAAYMAKAVAEPGAVKTESGLIYKELAAGTGASPKATDKVKVNYRGTLLNGTEFDSSYKRNMPLEFPLNGVIKCWTEGVQRMKVGGKSRLACPADIAYGPRGNGLIPGNATLIFEIELLDIIAPSEAAPPAPPAPPAPAAAPAPPAPKPAKPANPAVK